MNQDLWLIIRGAPPALGSWRLSKARETIGRHPECTVCLAHPSVSRMHAEIVRQGRNLRIRDLGSRNGTFVDDMRVQQSVIRAGNCVRIGHVVLDVRGKPTVVHIDETDGTEVSVNSLPFNDALTAAQRQVLPHLMIGLNQKEIAEMLCVSYHTVHSHVQGIYRALNIHSHVELMALMRSVTRRASPRGARRRTSYSSRSPFDTMR